jgi:uncharacterized membrane-anchored protein
LNLRGRVAYRPSDSDPRAVRVEYGLDAFYMQEGTARAVEDALRQNRNVQMQVAVAASGRSRIRALLVDGVRAGG